MARTHAKAKIERAESGMCDALSGLQRKEAESEGRLLISGLFTDCPGTRTWYNCWAPDGRGKLRIRTSVHPLAGIDTAIGTVKLLREDKPRPLSEHSAGKGLLDRVYLITLERKGGDSSEEMALGYANAVDWEAGRIKRDAQIRTDINKTTRALGFEDGERLAHINRFYPLIEAPELKRNGIGTAVLARMIGELESEGLAGAFATTVSDEMAGFLDYRGFGKKDGFYFMAFRTSSRSSFLD